MAPPYTITHTILTYHTPTNTLTPLTLTIPWSPQAAEQKYSIKDALWARYPGLPVTCRPLGIRALVRGLGVQRRQKREMGDGGKVKVNGNERGKRMSLMEVVKRAERKCAGHVPVTWGLVGVFLKRLVGCYREVWVVGGVVVE